MKVYTLSMKWELDPLEDSDSDAESEYCRRPLLTPQLRHGTFSGFASQGLAPQQENAIAKKPKKRPSKGKRLMFHKMIDELKERVRQEKENFDVESIQLASNIAIHDDTLAKIKTMMAKYREQVLENVDVPDLDAKPRT